MTLIKLKSKNEIDILNNMKQSLFIFLTSVLLSGCVFSPKSVNIMTTKPWEGHYMTVEEFKQKTDNIQLEEGISIWVISNTTLYEILKKS